MPDGSCGAYGSWANVGPISPAAGFTDTTVVVATHDRELIRRVGRRTLSLDHGSVVEAS